MEYIEKFIQLKKTCNNFILEFFETNHNLNNFSGAGFLKVVSDNKIVERLSTFYNLYSLLKVSDEIL